MEYPKRLRFTSQYRNYKIFFVSPTYHIIDGQKVNVPGKPLEFENWECVCNDPETIKLALSDGYYGKDYTSPEWEQIKANQKKDEYEQEEQDEDTVSVQKKRGRRAAAKA